jgi:micrococcal nuclease
MLNAFSLLKTRSAWSLYLALAVFTLFQIELRATHCFHDISSSGIVTPYLDSLKVVGIKDGDTFVVLMHGREQIIRLEHIDCPERGQPFSQNAKELASDLCYSEYVYLQHNNQYDRYGRLISEVILLNGINVNKELVRQGLAWHFKRYSNDKEYADLEEEARLNRVGLWREPSSIPPWQWRKKG